MAHEEIKIGYFEIYLVEIQKILGCKNWNGVNFNCIFIYNPKHCMKMCLQT